MSQPAVTTSLEGASEVCRALKLMALKPKEKQRFLYYMGKEIEKQTRRNQKAQQNIDGTPWKPRKNNKRRKTKSGRVIGTGKMMKRLPKAANMKVFSNSERGLVTWKKSFAAMIAKQQQEGTDQTYNAPKGTKGFVNDKPATDKQAKALIDEGFKRRMRNGTLKRCSRKWIRENMNRSHAGVIIKNMRRSATKKQWNIPGVARSFLGCDETLQKQMANTILDIMKNKAMYAKG